MSALAHQAYGMGDGSQPDSNGHLQQHMHAQPQVHSQGYSRPHGHMAPMPEAAGALPQARTTALIATNSSKTGRRQHRSCDQCRKGKRACDALILRDWGLEPPESTSQDANGDNSSRGGAMDDSELFSFHGRTLPADLTPHA